MPRPFNDFNRLLSGFAYMNRTTLDSSMDHTECLLLLHVPRPTSSANLVCSRDSQLVSSSSSQHSSSSSSSLVTTSSSLICNPCAGGPLTSCTGLICNGEDGEEELPFVYGPVTINGLATGCAGGGDGAGRLVAALGGLAATGAGGVEEAGAGVELDATGTSFSFKPPEQSESSMRICRLGP